MNRRGWIGSMLWSTVVAVAGLVGGFENGRAAEPDKNTVTLIIDFGDGMEKRFTALPAVKDGTVLDALNAAQKHPRGIKFEHKGNGATGLLTKIDDLKNEGNGRNWIFRVNDKLGDRSFAIFPVSGGDVVLWKFSEYR